MTGILVIEDQASLRLLVARLLDSAGYAVTTAATGAEGLRRALNDTYELVLLDLRLPDLSGEEVLRIIRAIGSESRIIGMSADSSISRRIGFLEAGAADFLPKPFANAELLARVRLRLGSTESPPPSAATDDSAHGPTPDLDRVDLDEGVFLDVRNRQLVTGDRRVPLSPRECALLAHLTEHRGDVCSRPDLLLNVWGLDFDPGTNVLDVCINRLRGKLSPNAIETVRNAGYRLAAS